MKKTTVVLFVLLHSLVGGCAVDDLYFNPITLQEEEIPNGPDFSLEESVLFYHLEEMVVDVLKIPQDPYGPLYGPAVIWNPTDFPEIEVTVKCVTVVFVIARFLEDYKFPPIAVFMGNKHQLWSGHAIYIYKFGELFGSFGGNSFDCQPPVYYHLDDLIREVAKHTGQRVDCYDIFDIRDNYSDYDTIVEPLPEMEEICENKLTPPVIHGE